VFDQFKSLAQRSHKSELTSLNLRTEPASLPEPDTNAKRQSSAKPAKAAQADSPPGPVSSCLQIAINPEGMLALGKNIRRRTDEWIESGQKPQVFFYLVFPQQGHTFTFTTKDGKRTILPLFASRWIAQSYLTGRGLQAVIAACRLGGLADQADKWIAAGINWYALNPCFRCGNTTPYPIAELQSEEQFLQTWNLDAVTRRLFAEIIVRTCQAQFASNPKGVRDSLERVRDHLDCGVPYLHWVIAILAGMGDDMVVKLAAVQRLEEFGPDFAGKLNGTSYDPKVPGANIATMPEAMMGLLASYGILDLPMKPAAEL
jgi:hypothetical protein